MWLLCALASGALVYLGITRDMPLIIGAGLVGFITTALILIAQERDR